MNALSQGYTTPLDHNNRAIELGKRGLWDQAVAEHELALNGDPHNSTFRLNLSGAYLRYGQLLKSHKKFEYAIQRFHLALYVDPNNRPAEDGCNSCYKALGKNPNSPDFRKEEGEKFETEANYPEAIAEFRQYVRMVDSGPAHYVLGRVLVKQGQSVPASAVEGFQELKIAISKDWSKDEQVDLGRAHLLLAEMLKELAFKARDDGRTQIALKRFENARIEYTRAVILMPDHSEASRGLEEVIRAAAALTKPHD